jgi:uncharacterized membrane protein YhaH (DUF805 family)
MVSFSTAIRNCFKKYAKFKGRAMRSEYWWWQLFAGLTIGLASGGASLSVGLESGGASFYSQLTIPDRSFHSEGLTQIDPFSSMAILVLFLPSQAVFVRRLHDINRSGWWILAWALMSVGTGAIGAAFIGSGFVALGRVIIGVSFTAIFIHQMVWMVTGGDAAPNDYGLRDV